VCVCVCVSVCAQLALLYLEEGGHLIWIFRPGHKEIVVLAHLLPLFTSFAIFRTNFLIKSQIKIALFGFRPSQPRTRQQDVTPSDGEYSVPADFPFPVRSRREAHRWLKSMRCDVDGYPEDFDTDKTRDLAERVYRCILQPHVTPLFAEQCRFLEWIEEEATKVCISGHGCVRMCMCVYVSECVRVCRVAVTRSVCISWRCC